MFSGLAVHLLNARSAHSAGKQREQSRRDDKVLVLDAQREHRRTRATEVAVAALFAGAARHHFPPHERASPAVHAHAQVGGSASSVCDLVRDARSLERAS